MSLNNPTRVVLEAFAASLIREITRNMTRENVGLSIKRSNMARKIARGYYPADGESARVIDVPEFGGTLTVWITPAPAKSQHKSSKHRVMCECPLCGITVPVGRLAQHTDTKTCAENWRRGKADAARARAEEANRVEATERALDGLPVIYCP